MTTIVNTIEALGRQIAFYPAVARAFGDVSTAVLVCQFIYWRKKVGQKEIYKTREEIEAETAIKPDAQRRIFKELSSKGFVNIVKKGLPARNYYRFNWQKIDQFLSDFLCEKEATTSDSDLPMSSDSDLPTTSIGDLPMSSGGESPQQYMANPHDTSLRSPTTTSIDYSLNYSTDYNTKEKAKKIDPPPTSKPTFDNDSFEIFWKAGLPKVKKQAAIKAFIAKLKTSGMSAKEFATMLATDINKRLTAKQFGFDKLHPTTYLNNHRWEDEIIKHNDSSTTSCGLPRTFGHIDYSAGLIQNEDGSYAF